MFAFIIKLRSSITLRSQRTVFSWKVVPACSVSHSSRGGETQFNWVHAAHEAAGMVRNRYQLMIKRDG